MSANGRYVAFYSQASNLVAGDTNGTGDIFVRDRVAGTTTRVSVATGGRQANGTSRGVSISADGRYVAFMSDASNLVAGDTNKTDDVFVRDRVAGTTTRVSVANGGGQANGQSYYPKISADGRYVAFASFASNLVTGDTNKTSDVFVRDRVAGTTTRVSVSSKGVQANAWSAGGDVDGDETAISANGRYVVFNSFASNLVTGDTNGREDVFVRDRVAGTTTRVSVGAGGRQADLPSFEPSISSDGRYVAFMSAATNLVSGDSNGDWDVFVRDRVAGTTTRVSVATKGGQSNGFSDWPSISADGRYVAFESDASNLVSGDTNKVSDVFVRDRVAGTTTRVSVATSGGQSNGYWGSFVPVFSADGRFVLFVSDATNLVAGDTNKVSDVFVRQLKP
ncbi:hypothetical protein HC031_13740 [Planosporangium thailandense]|uniref:Uncharacterized protein n=1 Tax=Planosporangium thailandense TaxID=765197 RepID=A0ABX0XXJ3_9ACTN|nr:hypothetical protein [Planosporangium thailandense]